MTTALVTLCAGFCIALCVALGALYCLAKFSIAQGRFDFDATERALKLQGLIDMRVDSRIQIVESQITKAQNIAGGRVQVIKEQPVDPNVQLRGIIDDAHEAIREANRPRNSDIEYTARDEENNLADSQPPLEV